jgi:hypothetical protein
MLIFVTVLAFKATRASIKEKKMNGLLSDENQYTPLEKKLLFPILLCAKLIKKVVVLLCSSNNDAKEEGGVETTSDVRTWGTGSTKMKNTKVLPRSSNTSEVEEKS